MSRARKLLPVGLASLLSLGLLLIAGSGDKEKAAATNNAVATGLRIVRTGACAAALPDGSILITGGASSNGALAGSELFDVQRGSSDAAQMSYSRANHACAALPDGRVLVAGGATAGGATINSAEIFDPSTGKWTTISPMSDSRSGAAAVSIGKGKVLIAGGNSNGVASASLDVFDAATGRFTPVAGQLSSPRMNHAVVALADGRVLIAGGTADGKSSLDTIDVYDPATGAVSAFSRKLSTPRAGLTATRLLDGSIYFAGGTDGRQELASAEIYNPKQDTWTPAAPMLAARSGHLAILVPHNNSVYLVGGNAKGGVVSSQELYIPWWNKYKPFGPSGSTKSTGIAAASVVAPEATATTTPVVPTLYTDKPDYSPGETAIITGGGWTPNAEVTLVLARDPQTLADTTWTTTADADGNLSTTYLVVQEDLGVTFTLTGTSGVDTAQIQTTVTFTDGSFSYSTSPAALPNPITLAPGASYTFNQTVSGPSHTAAYTATLTVVTIPASWVAVNPASLSFPAVGGNQTWQVTITVPLGTASGSYSGQIRANGPPAVGSGSGTTVNISVPSCTAPTITTQPQSQSITYGTNATFSAAASGSPSPTAQWQQSTNAGSTWTNISGATSTTLTVTTPSVSVSGTLYRAVFTNSCTPSTATSSSATLTVNPKALTVSGLTANNKTYNATTAATLSGMAALQAAEAFGTGTNTDGKPFTGDTVSVTGTPVGTFASKDVGTAIAVNVTGLSLTGAQFGNYTLTAPVLSADITTKALTASGLTANNRTYNATTAATLSGTAALQVAEAAGAGTTADGKPYTGDTVTVTGTPVSTFVSKDAGTAITVNITGLSLTGAQLSNYTLTAPVLSADITAKALKTSGLTANNKTYNGSTAATLSGTAALQAAEAAGAGTTTDGAPYTGDTVSVTGSPVGTFVTKDVGTAIVVNITGLSLAGASASNYTLTPPASSADITAKVLTVTGIVANNKIYDGGTSATLNFISAALSGVIAGDTVTLNNSLYTATFLSSAVGSNKPVTVTGLSLGGASSNNYTLTQPTGLTANITPVTVTASITAVNKQYDGTAAATVSSCVANGVLSVDAGYVSCSIGSATFSDANAGTGKTVTATGITLGNTAAGNYLLSPTTATTTANITPATPTLPPTQTGTSTYGVSTTLSVTITAVSGGATPTGSVAFQFNYTNPTTSASTTYNVCADGSLQAQPATPSCAVLLDNTGKASVTTTKLPAAADNITATYSGDTNYAPGEHTALNFTVSQANTNSALTVNPSTPATTYGDQVTLTANVSDATTNSTGTPTGNVQFAYSVNGGTTWTNIGAVVALDSTGQAQLQTTVLPAGSQTVRASYSGDANFIASAVSVIQAVNQKTLTVTGVTASNKIYDGNTSATLTTSGATLVGVVSGDTVSLVSTSALGTFADANVGTGKTVTVSGLSLTGASASNYILTQPTTTASITARPITVTADAQTKVYGASDPGLTYQVTSGALVSGDSFSGSLTRTSGENVGTFAINQGTLAAGGNYTLTYVGANMTITVRPITVTADAKSKTYGDSDPALTYKLTSGSLAYSDALSGALSRVAGENVGTYAIQQGTLSATANYALTYLGANLTITVRPITITADAKNKIYGTADPALTYSLTSGSLAFSDTLTGSLTRAAGENVGTYPIQQGTLSATANYALTYVGANFTITVRPITITADAKNKVYGDSDPVLTYQFTSGTLAFTDALSGSLTRLAGENAGTYAIQQGTLSATANYALTYVGANFTITARPITVTAEAKTKVYGYSDPALTYSLTSGTLAFTDALSGSLSRVAGENVGTYAIQQGTLSGGTNYALTFVGANLTITVRPITVAADARSKTYGDSDPALTYKLTSGTLAFSDALSGSLTRVAGENVGTYAIQQGTLAATTNYSLTYVGANLTITVRPITITADAKNKVYGDSDPALTYSLTSGTLAFGDVLTGSLARAAGENVGTYAIQQGTLLATANYALTYVGANLTITARPISVTADAKTKVYGNSDPALTYALTSGTLAFGDALTGSLTRAAGENVGSYAIQQGTVTAGGNYSLTYVGANLTITIRPVTVTAEAKTKVYGYSDPSLTYSLTSGTLAFTDALSGSLSRVAGENAGTYAIQQGTLSGGTNYALTFVGANLTITVRPITVAADARSKTYGDSDPALTYQFTSGTLAFSDALSGSLTRVAGENVGTYAIQQGTLVATTNYNLTYVGALFSINRAPITVTANNLTVSFGSAVPTLTGSIIGVKNNEPITAVFSTLATSASPVGAYTITAATSPAAATLSNYLVTLNNGTLTITAAPTTTTLSLSDISKQYSDTVTLTATISPYTAGGQNAATSVTFFIGSQNMGTYTINSGAATATVNLLEPTPFGTAPTGQMAPGPHDVTAVFGGTNPNFTVVNPPAKTLTITQEDARATYSGAVFVSTASPTTSIATIPLTATIQDITAVIGDQAYDPNGGDIRNARVKFVVVGLTTRTDAPGCTGLIPTLNNPADLKTGTVTCNWQYDIGNSTSDSLTVGIVVDNYYTRDSPIDNTVITISKPLDSFITGGGWILNASSSGAYAGTGGLKTNFGYSVKFNKNFTSLQGKANIIVRAGQDVYQIKTNSTTSLSVQPAANGTDGTATFISKANLTKITDPLNPISLGGNLNLTMVTNDQGEPGNLDKIAITLRDSNGTVLLYSSNWDGAKSVEQLLGGGNLEVHK